MTSDTTSEGRASDDFDTAQRRLFDEVGFAAESRFVDLDEPSVRTHVFESGESENDPPLVFVHGTAAFGSFLSPLMAQFPERRTIAFDRPGYGLSGPFVYTEENFRRTAIDVIEGVLDALSLDRVDLVGHSMGGYASVLFALDNPDKVRRLVTVGAIPGAPGTRMPLPFRMMTVPVLDRFFQRMQKSGEEGVLQTAEIFGEREAFRNHPAFLEANAAHDADPKSADAGVSEVNAVASIWGWRSSFPLRENELRELRHPTLVIWGDHDPVGSPDDVRDGVTSIPDVRFETVDAGHVPYLDRPERCAGLIHEMLSTEWADVE